MRLRELTAAERRTIRIGGTVILALIGGFRGVPAWNAWRVEARESAAVLVDEVARTAAMYDALPAMMDSLETRIARLQEMRPAPLVAGDAREAEAVLADLVRSAARAGAVQVTALEVGPDSAGSETLPRVSAAVAAVGDVTGLASFLSELEASSATLAVRSLSIAPQGIETPADAIETIIFRLRVEGLAVRGDPHRGDAS